MYLDKIQDINERHRIVADSGDVVRRSRNLRGLLRHLTEHSVKSVDLSDIAGGRGVVSVLFMNGDYSQSVFADFSVMIGWCLSRRSLQCSHLTLNGLYYPGWGHLKTKYQRGVFHSFQYTGAITVPSAIEKQLLPDVSSRYGAPMGRRDITDNQEAKCHVIRMSLVDGAYDVGGAYWGMGVPLWCIASKQGDFRKIVRALTRESAKEMVLDDYPDLTFYR